MLKLYNELASWWPLLSPPEEYLDEAEFFQQVFTDARLPSSPSFLELGCGGGNNPAWDFNQQYFGTSMAVTPFWRATREKSDRACRFRRSPNDQ